MSGFAHIAKRSEAKTAADEYAHAFAMELLMPENDFREQAPTMDPMRLAKRYGVPYDRVFERARELGMTLVIP